MYIYSILPEYELIFVRKLASYQRRHPGSGTGMNVVARLRFASKHIALRAAFMPIVDIVSFVARDVLANFKACGHAENLLTPFLHSIFNI